MISRYLTCIIAALAVIATAVKLLASDDLSMVALIFSVTIAVAYSLLLGSNFLASAYANRQDTVPSPSNRELFQAWSHETWLSAKVFLWYQPFLSRRFPDSCPSAADDGASHDVSRGVLLVHGFICNRGVWTSWYPELRRRNIPYIAINLEPLFPSIDCDAYAEAIERAVQRLRNMTELAPLIVCHSMGGLAVRAWVRYHDSGERIHRIVTLGTPHHGTQLASWVPEKLAYALNAQQMRFGSRWLKDLAIRESPALRSKFVCFYSNCDNVVYPASSGSLPDADNRHIPAVPHLALAFNSDIRAEVLRLL